MLGIEPRVQVLVDSFRLLPSLVAGTRRVAMIHELLVARLGLGPGSGIRLLDCPFDAVPVQEALWWHPVHTHDAGHLWLRELAGLVGAEITGPALAPAEEIRGAHQGELAGGGSVVNGVGGEARSVGDADDEAENTVVNQIRSAASSSSQCTGSPKIP